ncbi:MAG: hypothetical protein ACE5MI_04635 [Acidimicrobiia bacterium]
MERSWGKAARELGIGIGTSAIALSAIWWATPFTLELMTFALLLGVAWWVTTTDSSRLALGVRPTMLLFGGIMLALAAAISLFTSTARLMMLLIAMLLGTIATIWVLRILPR